MKTKSILTILTLLILAIALSACTGGRTVVASGWASVVADEDTAYFAYNNYVYAINLANGSERWRYPNEPDAAVTFYSTPALTPDGQLVIGGYNHTLYSLDPKTGALNWTYDESTGRYIDSPLITANGIFAPSTDKNLYAIGFNGLPLREPFATEKELWATPGTDTQCECMFVPSMDHRIYSVNATTGVQHWVTDDLGGAIVGTPALSEDRMLYIGTFANTMIALDADNGGELWHFDAQDWVWGGPAINGDALYFGDLSGAFYALDRQTGEMLWKVAPGTGSIVDTPLVVDDMIYFTAEEGLLVAVQADGSISWQKTFEGNTYASPAAAGDLILVTTSQPEALVVAYDANGAQKWTFSDAGE
ncbi:MAG: PQQ-binding-like beta-propeller repeat protein [Chloroflexi bacterium]|jgi:outer membrane protein assembly factor BamB|nr:PQQ-binding-like beta-propeller repeat protein [Chloroflexota bacterium]